MIPNSVRLYARRFGDSQAIRRLARGTFWSLGGAVISRGLGLVSSIFVARILGKEGLGELGIIQSTVGMFGTFAGFGLGLTATRYIAEFRKKDPARAGRILGLSSLVSWGTGGVMTLVLIVFAPWLATHTLAAPNLAGLLRIGALLLLLGAVNGAQTGALAGFEAFRTIARVSVIAGVASFPLAVGGAYFGGIHGAVWGLSGSLGVCFLLNHVALKAEALEAGIPVTVTGSGRELGMLWNFSLPVVAGSIMVSPANWVCNAMLANQPGGYAELGLFNAASQWRNALSFLPGILATVLLPVLVDTSTGHGDDKARKTFSMALAISLGAILLPTLVLLLFSGWIVGFYGASYGLPRELFSLLILSSAVANVGSSLFTCLQAINRIWLGALGNLVWAVVLVASFHLLLKEKSMGLAWANLISYSISMVLISPPILRKLFRRQE